MNNPVKDERLPRIDLQLFGKAEDEGRTEDPTPRRRAQARRKGQVAKSVEIPQALVILAGFWLLSVYGPYMYWDLHRFLTSTIGELHHIEFSMGNIMMLSITTILIFLKLTLPLMLLSIAIAVVANIAQFGWLFTLQPLKPDLKRVMPSAMRFISKLFISKDTIFEFAKSVAKTAVIGFIVYKVIKREIVPLLTLLNVTPFAGFSFVAGLAYEIILKVVLFLLICALFDYKYRRYQHEQSLKMTKEAVKDEWKMREGDPQVKAKIRERQREMAMRRMMQEVPKADVVITNPTHLAVAIRYVPEEMTAPTVVAKGEDFMAMRIREIAEESGVPIVENKPLAEALYKSCEVGDEIPEDLYRAVAEVLSYVYRMKGKTAVGG